MRGPSFDVGLVAPSTLTSCLPAPQIAFRVFDTNGDGQVLFDEFKNSFQQMRGPDAIPFDFDSPWVKLYLGKQDGGHVLGFKCVPRQLSLLTCIVEADWRRRISTLRSEFTQLIKGLQGERLRQAFRHFDTNQDGYIEKGQFKRIIYELARHKLSDAVLEKLDTVSEVVPGGKISYSECIAFYNVRPLPPQLARRGTEGLT